MAFFRCPMPHWALIPGLVSGGRKQGVGIGTVPLQCGIAQPGGGLPPFARVGGLGERLVAAEKDAIGRVFPQQRLEQRGFE